MLRGGVGIKELPSLPLIQDEDAKLNDATSPQAGGGQVLGKTMLAHNLAAW